ncbi:phosphoribosylformylglycinamidine synthase subunit PurQ [Chitinophaga pendula]|uniref:phosphoribosylformylglycinamidine synthase subunit PurQ n=1 Tax=Chitinophaga TaxID=79328 RepID=UPI000BB0BE1A|nr:MULTISPECIES: phosphoribosylformylglycinamidine synthase subunit PurQ [Chitinophaga]ASZ09511.1 phosphoribosylformylglycinamidine synthase I [Chitinophaga sp. MD30]UCJ07558.1 phosphoribosylformylglycinamidine synthase subunit PurQ [Chitinophaga pendula]
MKFGVVTFPGSNCDQDMIDSLRHDLGQEVIELWHKDKDLSMFSTEDCILLPGGFSYGDYLRCGAIARFSPMMQSVIEFANKGGRVIGICNGFQILCEAGLLPGALLRNENQQFVCKNIYLKSENTSTSITKDVTGRPLMIPVAHGEGRYHADEATLDELFVNNQVLFRYCDEFGNYVDSANPNGAIRNIAGICNKNRNVFGMMPHPERATSLALGNRDGQLIFQSLISNN